MTVGLSGSYGVNGTDFNTQPTEHNWVERPQLGVAMDGHIVYVGIRSYRLVWNLLPPEDFQQLVNFYNLVGSTGTLVCDLPQWAAADYRFYSYSGCTMSEPYYRGWFNEHLQDVQVIFDDIVT